MLFRSVDLTSDPIAHHRDPQQAVTEYEALFARGAANARMMANYLAALSLVGASAKLAAANDPGLLFRRTTLNIGEPIEPFLAQVADALLRAHTREFETARKSLREIERVRRTNTRDDPALAESALGAEEMAQAVQEFPPSSAGDSRTLADFRTSYLEQADPIGI